MLALVAAARLAQYLGAVVLFGSSLFFVYGLPSRGSAAAASLGWPRPALLAAALVLLGGAITSLGTQTASMMGAPNEAFNPESIWAVITGTQYGLALGVRLAITAAAVVLCLTLRPSRAAWSVLAAVGAAALASFAWTGHGAADEGAPGLIHAAADVFHLLASGVWLGALFVLALLLGAHRRAEDAIALGALHRGLAGFAGVGTVVVATLVLTGLINSWFLVGLTHLREGLGTPYGLLLAGKLAIFVGMVGLAAVNRFRLTPRLARALSDGSAEEAVRALRRSVLIETGAGLAVLALVSALGAVEPISALE